MIMPSGGCWGVHGSVLSVSEHGRCAIIPVGLQWEVLGRIVDINRVIKSIFAIDLGLCGPVMI